MHPSGDARATLTDPSRCRSPLREFHSDPIDNSPNHGHDETKTDQRVSNGSPPCMTESTCECTSVLLVSVICPIVTQTVICPIVTQIGIPEVCFGVGWDRVGTLQVKGEASYDFGGMRLLGILELGNTGCAPQLDTLTACTSCHQGCTPTWK